METSLTDPSTASQSADDPSPAHRGRAGEVFLVFAKLGLTSFGGPMAHLGYFRDELVVRRRWIGDAGYADLVALCQFLPGPASSQVGFALGLLRAGPLGGLAAWIAFSLPSAAALTALAYGAVVIEGPLADGLVHGLKIAAVAVVAQAAWGMARTLCPDRERASIAAMAVLVVTALAGAAGQIVAILLGGLGGLLLRPSEAVGAGGHLAVPVSKPIGAAALALFFALLAGLPALLFVFPSHGVALADSFYRSGALVFGGGHVVLPLLSAEVVPPGWISRDAFLTGYGLAQAVPGPLFTFAAYLGAVMGPAPNGAAGAVVCLVAIFVPGLLLVVGTLPFWDFLRLLPRAQSVMRGANAAVVGLLAAALYDPVWTSAILSPYDFALALVAFILLSVWRAPPWMVVAFAALGGIAFKLA